MSDARKIIEIYLDTERNRVIDANGRKPEFPFELFRNTRTVVRAHLVRADPTVYLAPPAGTTWFYGADNSYDPDHPDPVFTLDADFNSVTDWPDVNPTGGKVCWKVNTSTTALATLFTEANNPAKLGMVSELWMTSPGVSSVLLNAWDFDMGNIVTNIAADTTLEYVSNAIIDFDGPDTVVFYPDGSVARRFKHP